MKPFFFLIGCMLLSRGEHARAGSCSANSQPNSAPQ